MREGRLTGDASCFGSLAGGVVAFALVGMQINRAVFAGGPLKRHLGGKKHPGLYRMVRSQKTASEQGSVCTSQSTTELCVSD